MIEREGRQREYKEILTSYSGILKTVVAFSNDIGGVITVGVEDIGRIPAGVEEDLLDRYMEEIPRAIYDAISPYCMPQLNTKRIGDAVVLEIHVTRGARKPYFITSEGIPKGVYIRVGAHTKRTSPELLEDLFREGKRSWWDEEPVDEVEIEALDREALRSFYHGTWTEGQLVADKGLSITPTGEKRLTASGVLFFHPHPCSVFPQAEILFSQFAGTTLKNVVKTVDLSAPLPQLAEECLELLRPPLTTGSKREGLKLTDCQWEVPLEALREVLLNALIHRQYCLNDAIKVALFDDRVEVFSPGNFPGPINTAELGNGISFARNPHLRQLARRANLVEKRGFGYKLILDSCEANHNPPPLIEEGSTYVKVTLYRGTTDIGQPNSFPEECAPLRSLAVEHRPFQIREAAQMLGVSAGTARTRLKSLLQSGWLQQEGKGRAARYVWAKRLSH